MVFQPRKAEAGERRKEGRFDVHGSRFPEHRTTNFE
jgi:hypothetical protein